jgi:shikimate dehydrogenase
MEKFGLVGYPLGHSYSKKFFTEKFAMLGLNTHRYELYEMEHLRDFPTLWQNPDMRGVNVTVPHKENVIGFLDMLDISAHKVGAVNVVKRVQGKLKGFNTDYLSFKETLEKFLPTRDIGALILGTGGSSKAVQAALVELDIDYQVVSRMRSKSELTYADLKKDPDIVSAYKLIVNTTPLGTHPDVDTKADIPYDRLTPEHFLYDLVYNPEVTAFLKEGKNRGASVKNGLEMLRLQAEKSWEIWQSR